MNPPESASEKSHGRVAISDLRHIHGEVFLENRTELIARRFEIPPKLKMSTDLLELLGRII